MSSITMTANCTTGRYDGYSICHLSLSLSICCWATSLSPRSSTVTIYIFYLPIITQCTDPKCSQVVGCVARQFQRSCCCWCFCFLIGHLVPVTDGTGEHSETQMTDVLTDLCDFESWTGNKEKKFMLSHILTIIVSIYELSKVHNTALIL